MDFEGFLFLGSPRTNVFLSVPESSAVGFIFMNWTPRPVKLPTGVGKYDALLHFARRRHDALFRFRKWPKKHQKKFKKKERNQRENEFELDPFSRRLSLRHGLNHQTTRLLTLEDLAPVGWARASRIIRESGLWKIDEWKVFLFFLFCFGLQPARSLLPVGMRCTFRAAPRHHRIDRIPLANGPTASSSVRIGACFFSLFFFVGFFFFRGINADPTDTRVGYHAVRCVLFTNRSITSSFRERI